MTKYRQPASTLTRRSFGKLVSASAAALAMPSIARSQDRSLVYAVWGGPKQRIQREVFFDPFEKMTGIKVLDVPGTDLAKLRAMVENKAVEWDLMDVIPAWVAVGTERGLLEPLDYTNIKVEGVDEPSLNKFGFGYSTNAKVLAYNTNAFKDRPPTSFNDFWDIDRFPGARGLSDDPRYNLEIASFAAGVPVNRMYPLDVERAFKSLDKIKPNVRVWWKQWQQIPTLVASNELSLSMSSTPEMRLTMLNTGAPINFAWQGGVITTDFAVVPKGAKRSKEAMALIAFLSDPERQAEFANKTFNGTTSSKAYDLVDPKIKPYLPNERVAAGDLTRVDGEWWAANLTSVTQRWLNWKLV